MSTLYLPELRPDQWEIARDPAKVKVLSMGRRWGKSVLGSVLALVAASLGLRVAWVVPTYKNGRPLWRAAVSFTAPLRRSKAAEVNRAERTITFQNGGFLGIYSADNIDALRGEAFHLVIVDEAARIAEEAWTDAIQPTLADYDGDALLISTPKGRNWFWREWERGQLGDPEIRSWTAPSSANPNPRIQRAARLAEQRVPPLTYQQEWLALFVESGANTFSPSWWDGANRYDPHDANLAAIPVARYILWDTALSEKDGAAYSAALVVDLLPDYRLAVREVWRERMAFPDLVTRITALARKWNADGKLKAVVIEDKASGTSAIQTLAVSTERWLAKKIVAFMPTGSKEARAAQAAVWAKNGSILLPEPGPAVPWLWAFEEELFSFPQSEAKDQVDVLSMAALYLERFLAAGYNKRFRQEAA